jgi:hypothetical protein
MSRWERKARLMKRGKGIRRRTKDGRDKENQMPAPGLIIAVANS